MYMTYRSDCVQLIECRQRCQTFCVLAHWMVAYAQYFSVVVFHYDRGPGRWGKSKLQTSQECPHRQICWSPPSTTPCTAVNSICPPAAMMKLFSGDLGFVSWIFLSGFVRYVLVMYCSSWRGPGRGGARLSLCFFFPPLPPCETLFLWALAKRDDDPAPRPER